MKPALKDHKWSFKPPRISQQNTRKQNLKSSPVLNQKPATFKLNFEVFYLRLALSFFPGPSVRIAIGKSSFFPFWNSTLIPLKSWFVSFLLRRMIQSWRYIYIYKMNNKYFSQSRSSDFGSEVDQSNIKLIERHNICG
jgi:hypothetical protein